MTNKYNGFTTIELVISFAVLALLFGSVAVYMHPQEFQARSRDNKRLTDLLNIDRALNEFNLDYGRYPSPINTLFISTLSPFEGSPTLTASAHGWIGDDLSEYTSHLAIDPINDATYFYSYKHDESGYELNAVLEFMTDKMSSDGGNDPNVYEMGNNLSLISQ